MTGKGNGRLSEIDWGKVLLAGLITAALKIIVFDGVLEMRGQLGPLDSLVAFAIFYVVYMLVGGRWGARRNPTADAHREQAAGPGECDR